jgi:FkbH-like protein
MTELHLGDESRFLEIVLKSEAASGIGSLPAQFRVQQAIERLILSDPMQALDVIKKHQDEFAGLPEAGRLGHLLEVKVLEAKRYREAVELVHLLSLTNILTDVACCIRLSKALRQMGSVVEAKEVLSIALTVDPACLTAIRGLYELSEKAGSQEDAHRWLDHLAAKDGSYATMSFVYKERQKLPSPPSREIRIAVLSSYVLDWLVPYLDAECRKAKVTPCFYQAPFNQYTQEILNPGSELYRFHPDIVFLALGIEDLFPQVSTSPGVEELEQTHASILDQVLGFVRELESRCSALTVLHEFVLLPHIGGKGILDNKVRGGLARWLSTLNQAIAEELRGHERTFLLPLESVIAAVGRERGTNPKMWYMASMKLAEPALAELAKYSMRYIKPLKGLTRKCIVLDLDGTLWGGIVGEVGPEGVSLGPTAPGVEYVEFQKALLNLTRRGIILAICSKNNPEDALPVIRAHPHMVLREEHFAAMRINWRNKAENIREIAQELNIGLDSLVFIDDNPNERELVRQVLPDVLTVDLPKDQSLYRRTLEEMTDFDLLAVTKEDEIRVAQYQANAKRQAAKSSAASVEEYFHSLQIGVAIETAPREALQRLVQLFNKTNQFNLTTKRYQSEEVVRFMASQDYLVYDLHVTDRFGDHGLVGTAVVHKEQGVWRIDSLLMSCRVMGLGIETAFLERICTDAARGQATRIIGEYVETKKNQPVKDLYLHHGFVIEKEIEGRQEWMLNLSISSIQKPAWITTREVEVGR